jgi:molecular chaperone GrpE
MGVCCIDCVGEKFDPSFHNAVSHEENEEYDENVIIEELMKGYKYKDKIIRPSMVKVAN